jgi:hypothetical protein
MCQYMGDHVTNNQAEYAGLIAGLQAALELGCQRVKVQGDSTLIIRQVGRAGQSGWFAKHCMVGRVGRRNAAAFPASLLPAYPPTICLPCWPLPRRCWGSGA